MNKNTHPKYLTIPSATGIITSMNKVFIGFLLIATMAIAACGVKSDLSHPDSAYPRNYPVY